MYGIALYTRTLQLYTVLSSISRVNGVNQFQTRWPPLTTTTRGEGRGASSKVVTLDGVAIPLVDPQNFSEFWESREARRKKEREGAARRSSRRAPPRSQPMTMEKLEDLRRHDERYRRGRFGGEPGARYWERGRCYEFAIKGAGTFYTASQRQNQGAVAMYGEEVAKPSARRRPTSYKAEQTKTAAPIDPALRATICQVHRQETEEGDLRARNRPREGLDGAERSKPARQNKGEVAAERDMGRAHAEPPCERRRSGH